LALAGYAQFQLQSPTTTVTTKGIEVNPAFADENPWASHGAV
jgi:hypothetical protein